VASVLQSFDDSELGIATAISLHTLGALGFLAGVVGYLAWQRGLRRGHDNLGLLRGAAFTTYLSIAANLLGGFMRTYQSGHPHITQFAISPWVQAIAIKHLFLFTAMGAAVYLFERAVPRLRHAQQTGTLETTPSRLHGLAAGLALFGILMAALLGSVSQVVAELPAEAPIAATTHDVVLHQNFTGTLMGSPTMPAHGGGAFAVPANASRLSVRLDDGGAPDVESIVTEPDGTSHRTVAPVTQAGSAASVLVIIDHPAAGAWRFDLSSPAATGQAWRVEVKTTVPAAGHPH
jgi:hypothetical protein